MGSIILQLTFLIAGWVSAAQASYYNFHCPTGTEIEFYDTIDSTWVEGLHTFPADATVVRFQSPGGLIEDEEVAINQLRVLAYTVSSKSGTKLKAIVANSCASACTIFMAGLNQLAGQGQIELIVDNEAKLGFHAGVITESHTVYPPDSLFPYYSRYGIPANWLNQNRATFSTPVMKWVAPLDPWLVSSQILSHAKIVGDDVAGFPIPSSSACTQGPYK